MFLSSVHALAIAEVLGCKMDDLYVEKGEERLPIHFVPEKFFEGLEERLRDVEVVISAPPQTVMTCHTPNENQRIRLRTVKESYNLTLEERNDALR